MKLEKYDETFEDKVDRFVRDVTKVIPMPKSEVKRRLVEIIKETEDRVRGEVLEGIKSGKLCSNCGKLKDNNTSEWCRECLEEA